MANPSIFAAFERMWQHVIAAVGSKANIDHTHDEYCTEIDVDTKLESKSDTNHNHDDKYETKDDASKKLEDAIEYTDEQVENLQGQINSKADANRKISESDLDNALIEKVNAASEGNHSHTNKTELDGITSDKITAWDSAETNVKTYVDAVILELREDVNKKAEESHEHFMSDIESLSETLDTKVPASRKVNDKELSTDITLSANDVGAATPAEVNAVQTNLDTHTNNSNIHVTSEDKTKWNNKSDFSGNYNDLTNKPEISASAIGLGNVNNTSDANKPVSTAQKDAIDASLASAKEYTNTKTTNMATTSVVDSKISTHNTATNAHSDIRATLAEVKEDVDAFFKDATISKDAKDTLKEIQEYITSDVAAAAAMTASINNKADKEHTHDYATSNHNHNDVYYTETEIDTKVNSLQSAINGKAPSSHTHEISNVTNLQTTLDEKSIKSHTHTVSHTPSGTVSKPSFTGTEATISTKYTPVGTVSKPTFTGSAVTSGAPSDASTVASSTHTHKYTPVGTVSKPTFSGSAVTSGAPSNSTTSVNSVTNVGSAPSLTASVTNRCLTLSFSAGSVPTVSAVTLPNTSHTHSVTAAGSVSQPTFTGTEGTTTSITGTTKVASEGHTHSVTASGSVSQPTFTGTEATISTKYTPAGSVSQPTFSGTAVTLTTSGADK